MLLAAVETHRERWEREVPHIPYGYCQCGCGQQTKLARSNCSEYGWIKGCPLRFIHNHTQRAGQRIKARAYRQRWAIDAPHIPFGLCWCGCGEAAPISTNTDPKRGLVKGEPRRYVMNHHRRSSPLEFIEEDRGYETKCWVWQRGTYGNGYGRKYVAGKDVPAHRFYYEQKYGVLPEGHDAHHDCEVKACCNPDHVFPVEHAEHTRLHHLGKRKVTAAWTGAELDLSKAAAEKVGLIEKGKSEVSVVTSPTPSSEAPEIVELPKTGTGGPGQ